MISLLMAADVANNTAAARWGFNWWIILSITFIILAYCFGLVLAIGNGLPNFKRLIPPKSSEVKIAYKKAWMNVGDWRNPEPFKGVTGTGYGPDDKAKKGSLGFHAYSEFEDAKNHSQEGNVLLEVVLSGRIEELDLGYIAERQRVIQVIPYRCDYDYCRDTPTHFVHQERVFLHFACPLHAKLMKTGQKIARFTNLIPFVERTEPFVVEPISKLPWRFPWLREHRIAVASLRGKDKFVPTELH